MWDVEAAWLAKAERRLALEHGEPTLVDVQRARERRAAR
jgi:hypothetical protein